MVGLAGDTVPASQGGVMAMVYRKCPKCGTTSRVPNNRQVFCPSCGGDLTGALGTGEKISAVGKGITTITCSVILLIIIVIGVVACFSAH
jgi:hypothetical protein